MLTVENLSVTYGHSGKKSAHPHEHERVPVHDRPPFEDAHSHECCGYIGSPAVDAVSFHLEKGDRLGIVGESGSGKTTLGLSIMGLLGGSGKKRGFAHLSESASATVQGRILFKGESLLSLPGSRLNALRWQTIAMVFQNSLEVFNPVLTIGTQITEPLQRHAGFSFPDAMSKAKSLMEEVGLSGKWLNAYPHELSGGMRQRVLIAMAISCEPELLIVDEPTTSLDPESSRYILDLIDGYLDRTGASMIMISHNMSAIRKMTRHIMTLYSGCVIEEGRTDAVFDTPMHSYTRGLLNASPDYFIYKDLWGIPGDPPLNGGMSGCPFYPRCTQRTARCAEERPQLQIVTREASVHGGSHDSWEAPRRVACHKGGIEVLLDARNIHKSYGLNGKLVAALKGVDMEIRSGEVVALVGHSGSGKSTLAQILVHAVTPDRGTVIFLGESVKGGDCTRRMDGLQIVFQDASSAVSDRMTVLDAVLEPLKIMGWKKVYEPVQKKLLGEGKETGRKKKEKIKSALHCRAVDALKLVHLPVTEEFFGRRCRYLSGGQRQRLAIARALITRPRLLVADEITAMLDPSTRANLIRELKGIQSRSGFSMLFITHDLFLARKIADRVYEMSEGVLTERRCSMFHHAPNLHIHNGSRNESRLHCHDHA